MDYLDKTTKFTALILKTMPFSASNKRDLFYKSEGVWGDKEILYGSDELLNGYDLITLAQIAKYFTNRNLKSQKIKFNGGTIDVFELTFFIKDMLKDRNIKDNTNNRKYLLDSFSRLFSLKAIIKNKDKTEKINFIYRTSEDNKNYRNITILADGKFINACREWGIILNFSRLTRYKRNNYAILLDSYLQATKENKKGFPYKFSYHNDDLIRILKLNDKTKSKQKEILKKTFKILTEEGKLPEYKFDRYTKKWMRTDKLITYINIK